jgi:6-phosphogluconolactonase/glucosamine-6-phosphate isomerase/deaminase
MDNGFDVKLSTLLPVLLPELDLAQTAEHYDATIRQAILDNDVIIGQFGIGPDGHIAGILPKSPATTSSELAAGYDAPPYQRLTLTFPALQQITAAYVMVFGGSKHEALLNLQTKALSIIDQPAQILKNIPEAYVYNDQIGGEQ